MTTKEAIEIMYQAAICALCQEDDNATGLYPCNCKGGAVEKRHKTIQMLINLKNELIGQVD